MACVSFTSSFSFSFCGVEDSARGAHVPGKHSSSAFSHIPPMAPSDFIPFSCSFFFHLYSVQVIVSFKEQKLLLLINKSQQYFSL